MDRFRLNTNAFGPISIEHQFFTLTVTVVYNESMLSWTSGPLLIAIGPHVWLERYTANNESSPWCRYVAAERSNQREYLVRQGDHGIECAEESVGVCSSGRSLAVGSTDQALEV